MENKQIQKELKGVKDLMALSREDNKAIIKALEVIAEKVASKDNIKLNVVAEQEGVRDVAVKNFPEVQKVEITNHVKQIDTFKILNTEDIGVGTTEEVKKLHNPITLIKDAIVNIGAGISQLTKSILKVEVVNQKELPAVQKVEVTNPSVAPNAVRILNELADEAIPVRLVDRKGKFYEAIATALSGSVNMQPTNELLGGLKGASFNGSVELTNANTWYPVPATALSADCEITISKEVAGGTIRWGWSDSGSPGATNGNKFTGNDIVLRIGAGQVVYFASSTALDRVNWTAKILR